MQKEQIHIGASKGVAGGGGLLGTIDHAQVDDLDAGAAEALRDLRGVIVELLPEAFELTPVGFQADGEESYAQLGRGRHGPCLLCAMKSPSFARIGRLKPAPPRMR